LDKFPEAFRRFEKDVDTRNIRRFQELRLSFSFWAGRNWKDTRKQNEALRIEARKRGFRVTEERRPTAKVGWRHETITVRGKLRSIYRDVKTGRFIKKP
jgi:hypothetical protein